jgi:hypothetical protein
MHPTHSLVTKGYLVTATTHTHTLHSLVADMLLTQLQRLPTPLS